MYHIFSLQELAEIKQRGEYSLDCDIDCQKKVVPFLIDDFQGIFHGNGHTLKNLVVHRSAITDGMVIALIQTAYAARIENLRIEGLTIEVDCGPYSCHEAALIGEAQECYINNVSVSLMNAVNDIPMIYDAHHCYLEQIQYSNGFCNTICEHK